MASPKTHNISLCILLDHPKVLENVLGDPEKSWNFVKVRDWEP